MAESSTNRKRQQPIFKAQSSEASTDASPHLSLRSYISKHIQQQAQSSLALPLSDTQPSFSDPGRTNRFINAFKPAFGDQIYGLDTELNAGIEQYLPTPAIRLRVIKERLRREISQMEDRLVKYQAIKTPSPSLQGKIERLEQKLATLIHHEQQVDQELTALFSETSAVFQMSAVLQEWQVRIQRTAQNVLKELSVERWIYRTSPDREQLDTLNHQLQDLTAVMQEHMKRRSLDPEEISDIVNQYDQTLRQIDAMTTQLKQRNTLWEGLNTRVQQAYRKIYT